MVEINLDKGACQQEALKSQAGRMLNYMLELQLISSQVKSREGLKDFVPSLWAVLEEMEDEVRGLKQMERGLGGILDCWKEAEARIVGEYQQENVSQPRFFIQVTPVNYTALKDMGNNIEF